LDHIGFILLVEMSSRSRREYSVKLMNNQCLVVKLKDDRCSCGTWQMRGLPCVNVMAVIEKEKLRVYNYVYSCYKALTQRINYLNVVHPMETHDYSG